jgi:hypothetical protein
VVNIITGSPGDGAAALQQYCLCDRGLPCCQGSSHHNTRKKTCPVCGAPGRLESTFLPPLRSKDPGDESDDRDQHRG